MIAISESQENAISFPQMHRGSAYPDHTPSSPTVLSLPHPFCRGDPLNAEVLIGYAREIRDEVLEHAFVFDQQGKLVNYAQLTQGASCFINSTCITLV